MPSWLPLTGPRVGFAKRSVFAPIRKGGGFFVPIRLACIAQGSETETLETSRDLNGDPWLALGTASGALWVSRVRSGNQNALAGPLRNRFGL
jgi:hypothetical protein